MMVKKETLVDYHLRSHVSDIPHNLIPHRVPAACMHLNPEQFWTICSFRTNSGHFQTSSLWNNDQDVCDIMVKSITKTYLRSFKIIYMLFLLQDLPLDKLYYLFKTTSSPEFIYVR